MSIGSEFNKLSASAQAEVKAALAKGGMVVKEGQGIVHNSVTYLIANKLELAGCAGLFLIIGFVLGLLA